METHYYMWSEHHYAFIQLTESEFDSETSIDGYPLINNYVIVKIVNGEDILYHIHFDNVHGIEIKQLNLLCQKFESQFNQN